MPKTYVWLEESTDVVGGSFKETKESITWKGKIVATLAEPAGAKAVHWSQLGVEAVIAPDFKKAKVAFTWELFQKCWQEFLEESARRVLNQA